MSVLGIYRGRRVLVTGHTGFKGSWLSLWLRALGARVAGFSSGAPTEPSHAGLVGLDGLVEGTLGDIRDLGALREAFEAFEPEVVFHLAAQALVSRGLRSPLETFETNAMGTAKVLACAGACESVRAVVVVTSDKVYESPLDDREGYREDDRLGGVEPYGASKACAELVFRAFAAACLAPGALAAVTVRAGNVIGGGDWAEGRLVPDCVRRWGAGESVVLRCPRATRPWQYVLEPLSAYLQLGAVMLNGERGLHGASFNVGPRRGEDESVEGLVVRLAKVWPQAQVVIGEGGQSSEDHPLRLDSSLIEARLGWRGALSLDEAAGWTVAWYRDVLVDGCADVRGRSEAEIARYTDLARDRGLKWAL